MINSWANFLFNEKLDPKQLSDKDTLKLIQLCEALAQDGPPNIRMHTNKIESRRKVCRKAFDLGIDLLAMKKVWNKKTAIGRGLLDVWNEEYAKRFGSAVGTTGYNEVIRRAISTRQAEIRHNELQEALTRIKALLDKEQQRKELKLILIFKELHPEYIANQFGWELEETKAWLKASS